MKKNLILMSALFAGAMFMNDGFCANGGIPFDQTCDGVTNYLTFKKNGGNLSERTIKTRLEKIADHRDWLNGLSQGDKIALIGFFNGLRVNDEQSPINKCIDTITNRLNELIAPAANIVPNDEVQNHVVDVVVNQAQDEGMEINELQLDALQDDRRRAHDEIEDVNGNGDESYCVKRIKKIASKSKEKLHQAGEAVKPAIDYVKNNPVQSIGYAAGAVVMSTGAVTIAKKLHDIICYWLGYLGW